MPYDYKAERAFIFTEPGSVALIRLRDHALSLLEQAGAVSADVLLRKTDVSINWQAMALVDRLVEMGDLVEVTQGERAYQSRVFVGRPR